MTYFDPFGPSYPSYPVTTPSYGATWTSTTTPAAFITINVVCPDCSMGYEIKCWPLGEEEAERRCTDWLDDHGKRAHPE